MNSIIIQCELSSDRLEINTSCNSQINRNVVQGYRKYYISRVTKHKLKLKLGIKASQHPTDITKKQ